MHEYSIVQALVDRVEQEARTHGAAGVRRVRVRIGELSGVDAELLETAYRTFCPGTCCEAAPLEVAAIEALWRCPRCEAPVRKGERLVCPGCGVPARLVEGDEILLERVELEVA